MITVLSSLSLIVLIVALILLNIVTKYNENVIDKLKENIEHHRIKLKKSVGVLIVLFVIH